MAVQMDERHIGQIVERVVERLSRDLSIQGEKKLHGKNYSVEFHALVMGYLEEYRQAQGGE